MKIGMRIVLLSLFGFLSLFDPVSAAGEIVIVGTGDGMTLLRGIGAAFTRANPGVIVRVPESIGSSGGIRAVGTDQYRIGRVARQIKDKEKPYGLSYVPIAKIPVVFFVNRSVGLKNLSAEQVAGIYSGKITNWKMVGGKDAKIRVVRREEGDSSLTVLKSSFPGFKDLKILSKSKTTTSTTDNIAAVTAKEGAIGFGPYSDAAIAEVDVLIIDGKSATDADYPSFGTLALVFKPENKKGELAKFIDFAASAAAQDVISAARAVPY